MDFLNIHTHRNAVPGECAVRSWHVPDFPMMSFTEKEAEDRTCFAFGWHPWYLDPRMDLSVAISRLAVLLQGADACMIGECGLDRCCRTDLDLQISYFRAQVDLAERMEMPVVVHCVRSFDLILKIRKFSTYRQPWVIHGFRGKGILLEQLLRAGMYVSFGAHFQENSLKACPVDRFFLETDDDTVSVKSIYERAARLKGFSTEKMCRLQWDNFSTLFPNSPAFCRKK